MRTALRWIFAPWALLLVAAAGTSQLYVVDPAASNVSAKVSFLGIGSRTAGFPKMSGTANIRPDRLQDASINVALDARALTAPDKVTLGRLRGEKFFWVEKYPAVRFAGSGLTMTGARTGTVTGKLTARGVTKPVSLKVTFDKAPASIKPGQAITINGVTTINRRDFGMKSYSLIVGKNVTIRLKARMVPS